jgi:hypothetical protein
LNDIWKYSTKDDRVEGKTTLGYSPHRRCLLGRQFSVRRQFQSAWGHGAVIGLVVSTATMTESAHSNLHDARTALV